MMTETIISERSDRVTINSLLRLLNQCHPDIAALIDGRRAAKWAACTDGITSANEFESDADGGRGDSYRRAQRNAIVRGSGFGTILRMAVPRSAREAGDTRVPLVLDVLGGDGTMARAARLLPGVSPCRIITSDLAGTMVLRALEFGLPAVRQPAEDLLLRNGSVDAVIMAYGTHHLEPRQYSAAVREATRVLRYGGRLVTHDFEPGSDMTRFFEAVVDRHTRWGHPYPHISGAVMRREMLAAGLVNVRITEIEDPFQVTSTSPLGAKEGLLAYLRDMYGLRSASRPEMPIALEELEIYCNRYFSGGITVRPFSDTQFIARLARTAVVAVGQRPEEDVNARPA
jgi:SAM-dependent methyltransferase